MELSVIIPVYNEAKTIQEIIHRVSKMQIAAEIVVVDDGSADNTPEILKHIQAERPADACPLRVFLHPKNRGKGAAVVTGLEQAAGDLILIQDADLEYDPRDIPAMLRPIQEGNADVVYGSRFLGAPHRSTMFWHMVANNLLTLMTNILYDAILTDMETGYKLFRSEAVKGIKIHARRFDFEPEFTAKILKRKVRIYEVPISFNARDYTDGKKIGLKDAFSAVWALFIYRIID